jgi:hypothetical protein
MSRTTTFRNQSYNVIAYPLSQIIGTDNCRRPCPMLWNLGLDPWEAYRQVISDDLAEVRKGVAVLEQSPRFCEMAATLKDDTQLQAIGLRSYRARAGKVEGEQQYEDRAALSFGNGRLFGMALLEGRRKLALADGEKVSKTPLTIDAILMRLTREESYELSIIENDKRSEMDDLDWGLLFDRDLKTVNPQTKKLHTIKEVAEKRGKNYHWVRGRAALPYLPAEMLAEITDWDKVNIDALCQTALTYKAGAKQDAVVDQGEAPATSTVPTNKTSDAVAILSMDSDGEETPSTGTGNEPKNEGEGDKETVVQTPERKSRLPRSVQPKKRRTVMTMKEMGEFFAEQEDDAAKAIIAQCMKMTVEEAKAYAETLN